MYGFSDETIKSLIAWAFATGGKKGAHITRFAMYQKLAGFLAPYDAPTKAVLAISHSANFGKFLGLNKSICTEANYPEYSLSELAIEDATFDFCISDQVLEHVEADPFIAFRETVRILKPGGFVCHTTCFINEVHGNPKDFWRFTTDALRLLATTSGCTTVELGGWGNREAWALIEAGFRFENIPDNPEHPLHKLATRNEVRWPIVVWIVAQKPGTSC